MNVLFIASECYPIQTGGVGIHVHYVSYNLAKRSHRIFLIVPASHMRSASYLTDAARYKHQSIRHFIVKPFPLPLGTLSFVMSTIAIVSFSIREKIDVVHVHSADIATMLPAYIVGRLKKMPLIVTAHGSEVRLTRNRIIGLIQKLLFRQANVVTCVSREIAGILLEKFDLPGSKISLVPNGYEKELTSPLKRGNDHFRVVFVGNLRRAKDPMTLIRGFEQVARKFPDVCLSIIGDGTEYQKIQRYCSERSLLERISLPGRLSHSKTLEVVAASDVFVLTSIDEGLPTALIEAMSFGKPVIATAVGGVPEVVKDGVNGVLIPPKSPQHVADSLERLLSDSELRRRLGEAAAESVKDYEWSRIAEKYEGIYDRVLREARAHV